MVDHHLGWALVALLVLAVLAGCPFPGPQVEPPPPEETLSFDQLIANLDALQGPAAKDLGAGALALSAADLALYLDAIKTDLAAFVKSRMGGTPYLVTARKMSWDGPHGRESGLMWVPVAWGLKAPIILYQHGTQVYQECAPSRYNSNPLAVFWSPDLTGALQNYVECTVGALMASAGYIVVMPDYEGFGDSTAPDHPYVTLKLGESVKGALQRAKDCFWWWSAVKPSGKVFITGYSEGGYAAMAGAIALQAAGGLPAGYTVKAVLPCDGAYDLSGTMLAQMLSKAPIAMPGYLLYTTSGYHAVYPDAISFTGLLVEPYAARAAMLFNGEHTNAEVALAEPVDKTPYSMLQPAARDALEAKSGDVYARLSWNDAWCGWKPGDSTPVYFIHCPDDEVVPPSNVTAAMANLPSSVPVQVIPVPAVPMIATLLGTQHVAAFPTAMVAAFLKIDSLNR
jgi:pimeloyl-ACP methyl ester carboxylesterase